MRTLVLHFHELWLKGGNRNFFLGKLLAAVRQSLEPLPNRARIAHSRILVDLEDAGAVETAVERLKRVFGVVYYAVARRVEANPEAICASAAEDQATAQRATTAKSFTFLNMGSPLIAKTLGR